MPGSHRYACPTVPYLLLLPLLVMSAGCRMLCLVEGTRVDTPTGLRAIESLRVGDQVICVSAPGVETPGRIVAMESSPASSYEVIYLDGCEIPLCTTPSHPIAQPDGWKLARELRMGDEVVTKAGFRRINRIETQVGRVRVFDIAVSPFPGFYANGILVHNKSIGPPPREADLVGIYTGRLDSGPEYDCRLELSPNGQGYWAWSRHAATKGEVYVIDGWHLTGSHITIDLHTRVGSVDSVPILVDGVVRGTGLDLVVKIPKYEGAYDKYGLRMRPEDEYEAAQGRLRALMREAARGHVERGPD